MKGKSGVNRMAAKVEHIVINTDRARLARLKKAITFEAVPPGQQLTRINPTARSFSKSKPFANENPRIGIMINCAPTPIPIATGVFRTSLKSLKLKVSPMPSMMTPSPGPIYDLNHANDGG